MRRFSNYYKAFAKTEASAPAVDGIIDMSGPEFILYTVVSDISVILSNMPNEPTVIYIEVTNGGAHTITWDPRITWANGVPPSLTAAGTDVISLVYNGTVVRGFRNAKDIK